MNTSKNKKMLTILLLFTFWPVLIEVSFLFGVSSLALCVRSLRSCNRHLIIIGGHALTIPWVCTARLRQPLHKWLDLLVCGTHRHVLRIWPMRRRIQCGPCIQPPHGNTPRRVVAKEYISAATSNKSTKNNHNSPPSSPLKIHGRISVMSVHNCDYAPLVFKMRPGTE